MPSGKDPEWHRVVVMGQNGIPNSAAVPPASASTS